MSDDFNYSHTVRLADYTSRAPIGDDPLDYPVKGPKTKGIGFEAVFQQHKFKIDININVLTDIRPKEYLDGYHLIIHDPYEIPSEKSVNIFTLANTTTEYLIDPKIVSFDESFKNYALAE